MSAAWKRRLLIAAGRHHKKTTEGEIRRAAEVLAQWRGMGMWL